jgi:hypothetical protein
MKLSFCALAAALAMTFGAPAYAEKIDCENMVQLGAGMDQIRNGLANGEEVDEELYNDLGNVIEALRAVAAQEGNAKLDRALDNLEAAHSNNDRDGFISALDQVDELFGAFYTADCG